MRERFTIGVEEEYQLVDPSTGALRSRARVVRTEDRTGLVMGEVQETMLEIGTPICLDAAEVAARLRELRFQASAAATARDLEVVAAGLHPFSGWKGHHLADADRPRMLAGIYGQVLRQLHIYGMHVHVAVPEEFDRAVLMNVTRNFSPHLLALSCSSPYSLGEDTGFASFRSIAWRGFPFAGAPPRFSSAREYRNFIDLLLRAGVIPDERTVYWSVRPSSRYPTLEFRMCDACPRIADAVAIAALSRAIVVAAAEGLLESIDSSLSPSLQDEVLRENEWVAGRDGLDATLIAPESPDGHVSLRTALAELLEVVGPIAEGLGDTEAITHIESILTRGTAADALRARFAAGESFTAMVAWLVEETRTGTGLDRRSEAREEMLPGSRRGG